MIEEVSPNDELTRYIRPKEKKYVSFELPEKPRLKTSAFSIGKDGNISVFVTTAMTLDKIWSHGDKHYANKDNVIIGRGYFPAENVYTEELKINYDNIPPKHANIFNFPDSNELKLSKRQALAKKAKYQRRS